MNLPLDLRIKLFWAFQSKGVSGNASIPRVTDDLYTVLAKDMDVPVGTLSVTQWKPSGFFYR